MLRVLDAEAAIAWSVFTNHALEDIEQHTVGAVADRVHYHLKTGFVGARDPAIQIVGRIDEQPAIVWRVVEWLVECGGVRPQRTIDEALQPTDAQPLVASSVGTSIFLARDRIAEPLPVGERKHAV